MKTPEESMARETLGRSVEPGSSRLAARSEAASLHPAAAQECSEPPGSWGDGLLIQKTLPPKTASARTPGWLDANTVGAVPQPVARFAHRKTRSPADQ